MPRFDFLVPTHSQYDVLQHFCLKMYEALKRVYPDCRLINSPNYMKEMANRFPDFTIGVNGVPLIAPGVFLSDLLEKPHISFIVDMSFRFFFLLESPFNLFTCNDRFSLELLQIKKPDVKGFFLPAAVENEMSYDPDTKRDLEILFTATFIDFEERQKRWKTLFSDSIYKMMLETIERIFSSSQILYIEVFQTVFNEFDKQGLIHSEDEFNLIQVWDELELYVRGKERVDLLKSIQDAEVHIFGASVDKRGWKEYFQDSQPNLKFYDPVPFLKTFDLLKRSQFCLNSAPHLRMGVHERVFYALACGSVPITEENMYVPTIFEDKKDLLFYRHPHLDHINDTLHHYMEPSKREHLVQAGRKKVMAEHTWDNRVQTLIHYLQHQGLLERDAHDQ